MRKNLHKEQTHKNQSVSWKICIEMLLFLICQLNIHKNPCQLKYAGKVFVQLNVHDYIYTIPCMSS